MNELAPWYDTRLRWGQTNLVEADPARLDLDFWREQWARTQVQGILVNCGGIAAYYPSDVPHHKRAPGIDARDLFGEIVEAAHSQGLAVLARMDSNRGDEDIFAARPDWFCVDADGVPYRRGDKYATCISTDYYDEHMPSIFREVIGRYSPEGFADNGWAGIDRSKICYCEACARRFHAYSRQDLPLRVDWHDETFGTWVEWSYLRRTQLWEQNNEVTRGLGGRHCLWLGMLHGQLEHNASVFQDVAELARRTPVVLLDHQRRHSHEGFEQNAEVAQRTHSVLGWDRPVLECTAMYDMGYPAFRLSSMQAAEVTLWMTHGWSGGTHPWWHHIGAVHDDRRQYETAVDLFRWHSEHESLLVDRQPLAIVGVVWSQRNLDFHGRTDPAGVAVMPYAAINRVLVEANIPFVPVHVDRIAVTNVSLLVLPDLAVMTDEQCDAVRAFVAAGGSVIATGDTSLCDERGRERPDFALADVFGAHATEVCHGDRTTPHPSIEFWDRHSYLRCETPAHPVLNGLDQAGTISFGGALREVRTEGEVEVPLTFVPPFPIFPPETSWMRQPRTQIPAVVLRSTDAGGRVAFVPADLDRCSKRDEQPDHAVVLGNLIRWALADESPVQVHAQAPVSTHIYRQRDGLIVHLGNLMYTSVVPGRQARIVEYGPIDVGIRLDGDYLVNRVYGTVSCDELDHVMDGPWVRFSVPRLGAHEVVRIELLEEVSEVNVG